MSVEKRYVLAFLLCVANTICYADRTNIGIAIPSFVAEKKDRGIVLSSFFYGYILTQLPSGWWASRVGVKLVLTIGVIVWTVCDTSTVLVSHSIPLLILVRAGMGCGEGVIMPSLHRFAANWFPIAERSTLVAVISSGSDLGTISALLLSPWIMKVSHWTAIFLVFGSFSLIWLICFVNLATSKPEHHPTISNREKEYIISTRRIENASRGSQDVPWRILLSSKPLWSIYTAHFCFNYGWYVLLSWLPQYLQEELSLDLTKNEFLAATPYICGFIGLILGGHVSDRLIASGYRTLYVRRFMNCVATFIPAVFLILLRYVRHPWQAILCLSCALFTGRASTSGYWINMIDVGPEYAGKTMGMSNTIATIPGILGNLITGYILQRTQSWDMVFTVAAVITTIGGLVFLCFSTDRNVFRKKTNSDESLPFLKTIETI